jgi:predicted transcriptional regulator
MKKLKLGDSELELLRYVARNPGCTVREASDHFAEARGWGRTTVLKTLDRLREKELLEREEVDGIFRYSSKMGNQELDETLVHQFLSQSMEGSLKSFVAHLHTYPDLSKDDLDDLRRLVSELEKKAK